MPNKRRILFVRHAQRLDRYVREAYPSIKTWTQECFVDNQYRPINIEFPISLPNRPNAEHYIDDTPITTMGEGSAQIVGNRLAEIGIQIDMVYSSPALRCVQTGYRILQGYSDLIGPHNIRMRLDGGFYEYGSLASAVPTFLEPKFLSDRGFPIDLTYKNSFPREKISEHLWETYTDFKGRAAKCIENILRTTGPSAETIMIVTHAPTLLTFVRELMKKSLSEENLEQYATPGNILNKPAYIATVMLEENPVTRQWIIPLPQPVPSFEIRAHTSFSQSWLDKQMYDSPVV